MPALSVVMVALSIAQNKTVISSHDGASAPGVDRQGLPTCLDMRHSGSVLCLFQKDCCQSRVLLRGLFVCRNIHQQLVIFAARLVVIVMQSFYLLYILGIAYGT